MHKMEEYSKKVLVKQIVDFFHLEQITGDEQSLNRWVVVPDVNRPGFELAGYYKPTEPRRIIIIGNKEQEYISHLTLEQQEERFPWITDGLTPMAIITHNDVVPEKLKEIAERQNFPIFRTPLSTWRLTVDLITFLDENLAEEDTISGELLSVYGKGVLLTGESGMGKSEIALELIRGGQVLIADDRVDIQKIHNTLIGHAPFLLKGMLEIRGIGIIDVSRMYGANCIMDKHQIDIVIKIVSYDPKQEYDRIGGEITNYTKILDIEVPTIILPVSPGRSMRALVESAVTNFILQEEGYNSSIAFKNRLKEYLEKGKNNE